MLEYNGVGEESSHLKGCKSTEEVRNMIQKDCFSEKIVDGIKDEIRCCSSYVTREELASKVGTSRATLCRKINDPYKMSLADLCQIAEALGKSLHFYFE